MPQDESREREPLCRAAAAPATAFGLMVAALVFAFSQGSPPSASSSPDLQGPPPGGVHEHATYEVVLCGERRQPISNTIGPIHTEGDGVIHIEPLDGAQGRQATVARLIQGGGGLMLQGSIRYPGENVTYRNGDLCPDGRPGSLRVLVDGKESPRGPDTFPREGNRVRIEFG